MKLSSAIPVSIFTIVILVGAVFGQHSPAAQLGATDAGKLIVQYFQAFNDPDEKGLRSFFEKNIAAASLAQRPVEPRLAFHKQIKSDFGNIVLDSVVAITPEEIKVVGRSTNGSLISYTFEISPTEGKIVSLAIEPDGPASASPPPITAAGPKTVSELPKAIGDLFEAAAKDGRFSGVVLVAKDGVPIFNKAWGMAAVDKALPNRLDTKLNLGSINKLFTRIAIGQLVKAGKLNFSAKLIDVLPGYPNKAVASKITIGQLITMTSGLGDFFNDDFLNSDHSKIRSLQDYLPLFVNAPLEFEPGTKNRYSNAGYLVLGLVIEKLSGRSYYDYVRKNIFEPAGMSDTDSFEIDKLPANTAIGYMRKGSASPLTPNASALPGRGSSAGGGYSTAPDLLRLAKALKEGKLLVPKDDGTFATTFETTGMAGGSEGVNALFLTSAVSGYTVIVLSNLDPPSAMQPGTLVRDWIKQLTPP